MKSKTLNSKGYGKLIKRVPKVLAVCLIVFALATILLTIESSAQGATLTALETKVNQIESQNQELRSDLVVSTSLAKVGEEASKIGMVKPEKLTYLSNEKPVANKIP
ncbi:MAG TPA: hypothetical protein VF185_03040 [Patescibacteria group bacterium]